MTLARYCTVEDVLRLWNPSRKKADLQSDKVLANDDLQQIEAKIDRASGTFDDDIGRALRLQYSGSPGAPETYDTQNAEALVNGSYPIRLDLDYDDVLPIDASAGDVLELRTGRDSWDDITADSDAYRIDHDQGALVLYRRLIRRAWWNDRRDNFLRACYRYGGLGGDAGRGGQTTLSSAAGNADTTLDVANAARLYPSTLIVGNSEYVRVEDIDYANDEITVTRGVDVTEATSHDSGDVVHYCPLNVREAVAGMTAAMLVRTEDFVADLGDGGISPERKLDDWTAMYEQVAKSDSNLRLV